MNGIESNVLQSPYSLLISILLSLGVFCIGNWIQVFFVKNNILKSFKNVNFFLSPIIGTYFLLITLYLIIIFEIKVKIFLTFFAYLLIFFGIYSLKDFKKYFALLKNYLIKQNNILPYIIFCLFIFLFFISASVITHADAIDYHFYGALNILNFGHFYKEILPMHNNLVSLGEVIISLGLAVQAEQFLGILQFLSLLALIPFFKGNTKNFFLLFILVCPITFFLVSSSKPQLLFSISSLLIFIFLVNYSLKIQRSDLKIIFPILISILCINSLAKFSFHLSSILLGGYLFYLMIKNKLTIYSVITSLCIFIILYLPFIIFRHKVFQTGFDDLFFSPLPLNIYGYQNLNDLLTGGDLSIIQIFFPKSLVSFSTTYGPLLVLIFLMINKKIVNYKIPTSLIIIFIICIFLFGSNLPRFFFEGYLWLIFITSLIVNKKSTNFIFFSKAVYLQTIFMMMVYLFFIVTIFPGSLNQNLKKKILNTNANGYELASWTNSVLEPEDILLSTHRSISLFKNKTYDDMFTWHIDLLDPKAEIYLNFLKSKKINRILIYSDISEKNKYSSCIGKNLFYKKKAGKKVGRNPLMNSDYYQAWIYEFKYKELPGCLIK